MKASLNLLSVVFAFDVDGVAVSVCWMDNKSSGSNRKYEVWVCRGSTKRATFYTDTYINKSNSKDFILKSLEELGVKQLKPSIC